MWYASCVTNPKTLIGKPLVVYIDGERRQIGTITNAAIQNGSLYVGATLDLAPSDREAARLEHEKEYGLK